MKSIDTDATLTPSELREIEQEKKRQLSGESLNPEPPAMNNMHTAAPSASAANARGLPLIPLNLRAHKRSIAITFSILWFTGSALPILLYFVLKYPGKQKDTIYLSIPSVPFGVSSLYSFFTRLWRLTKKDSTCRPIGGTKWQLDFFQWDFLLGFVLVTASIVISVAIPHSAIPRLASLPLSILVFDVALQIFLVNFIVVARGRNPVSISSVQKGDLTRPALYSIVEDTVAVDAKQGVQFREAWDARYRASPEMRRLMLELSWVWGGGGIVMAGAVAGMVFGIKNHDAVYVIGWAVPWLWAGCLTLFTFSWVKRSLRREAAAPLQSGV